MKNVMFSEVYLRCLCNSHFNNFCATAVAQNLELMIKLTIHKRVFKAMQQSYIPYSLFFSILPDDYSLNMNVLLQLKCQGYISVNKRGKDISFSWTLHTSEESQILWQGERRKSGQGNTQ